MFPVVYVYFLSGSCSSLISLFFGMIPTFYLLDHVYPGSYSIIFCKMQGYITHTNLQITRVFLLLSCFDRYTLSSTNQFLRKFAQPYIALRLIPIVIILSYLLAIHLIIYLEIFSSRCGLYNTSVLTYNSIYTIVTIPILYPLIMLICSILTYMNLKNRQKRLAQIQQRIIDKTYQKDKKIFVTLVFQIILYFLSAGLYAPNVLYNKITENSFKSTDQQTIELLIQRIAVNLIYIYPSLSFYVFTLTSRTFRKEFFSLFNYRPRRRIQVIVTTNRTNNQDTF
ncbi:hypothetical protein I4U23_022429 [Adineta vaga]|nr:hypothetical protein I4U23_022429 [Adineta vaga]